MSGSVVGTTAIEVRLTAILNRRDANLWFPTLAFLLPL